MCFSCPTFSGVSRPVILAAVLALGSFGTSSAGDATPPPADEVRGVVARLGSASRADREAAERSLGSRGPVILAELLRLAPTCTGEVRLRLDRVIARFEAELVERATEPATVSLSVEKMPVREVLARIARDSGNPLAVSEEVGTGAAGATPVSLSLDRATYWEAVLETLSRGGLEIDCRDDGRRVVVVPASGRPAPRAAAGPLLVMVTGVETARAAADGRPVRLSLRLAWEPRIVPLVIRLPMDSVQVEGPRGESVPPSSRRGVLEATILPGAAWLPMTLPLLAKEPLPESLASVRATVRLWCAGGEHDFSMPLEPLPAEFRQRVGRAEVSFRAERRDRERVAVDAELVYDAPSEPLESHRMWLVDRELEILGPAGGRLPPESHRVRHRSDRGLAVTDEFAMERKDEGSRVRWRLPAAIRELPIDVTVRDVAWREVAR